MRMLDFRGPDLSVIGALSPIALICACTVRVANRITPSITSGSGLQMEI